MVTGLSRLRRLRTPGRKAAVDASQRDSTGRLAASAAAEQSRWTAHFASSFLAAGSYPEERARRTQLRRLHDQRILTAWGLPGTWILVPVFWAVAGLPGARAQDNRTAINLPDTPSALLQGDAAAGREIAAAAETADDGQTGRTRVPDPCNQDFWKQPGTAQPLQGPPPCEKNPIQPIVTLRAKQLNSHEKGVLAARNFLDPFNFVTITGYSAIAVAANSHTPYGPGVAGFGRLAGYGLAQDAQGEFFETYLIPSLAHQDPRYHRMAGAPFKRRLGHAVVHTFVSQHDDGSPMPNYATLLNYPISAELSNLYVPGIQTDGASTARRIAVGLATDPAGSIIAEFLPDVARRIHVRIVFVQQVLNQVMVGSPTTTQ